MGHIKFQSTFYRCYFRYIFYRLPGKQIFYRFFFYFWVFSFLLNRWFRYFWLSNRLVGNLVKCTCNSCNYVTLSSAVLKYIKRNCHWHLRTDTLIFENCHFDIWELSLWYLRTVTLTFGNCHFTVKNFNNNWQVLNLHDSKKLLLFLILLFDILIEFSPSISHRAQKNKS